jgi:hypothetical protein
MDTKVSVRTINGKTFYGFFSDHYINKEEQLIIIRKLKLTKLKLKIMTKKENQNGIKLTKIMDDGVSYVDPQIFMEKMGMKSKGAVMRVLDLFQVKYVSIGCARFYDELMTTIVVECWKNETTKVHYMRLGVSQEFEKRLNQSKSVE